LAQGVTKLTETEREEGLPIGSEWKHEIKPCLTIKSLSSLSSSGCCSSIWLLALASSSLCWARRGFHHQSIKT
jgi:hypothetical protein